MEHRLYDLAQDAVANAVDAGYLYVECVFCGSAGWWAKPLETIACPTCDKPITAPAEGQTLIEQIRAWREAFVEYPDSHVGAVGYQVCERLIDELTTHTDLLNALDAAIAERDEAYAELDALKATAGKAFDENNELRAALKQIENIGAESDGKTDLTVQMFYVAHRALGGER